MPLTNDIHPIVAKRNFSEDFDYDGVMLPIVRLFSQIITIPQSLHYFFAVIFGKSMVADRPLVFKGMPLHEAPQAYACNKGILELTGRDKAAVHRHLLRVADGVKFQMTDLSSDKLGGSCKQDQNAGKNKTCTITLSKDLYDQLLRTDWTENSRQLAQFHVAEVLLHEVAHGAGHVWFGSPRGYVEDFMEDSLIAEAGCEYQARVHGLQPAFGLKGNELVAYWMPWQTPSLGDIYDLDALCRDRNALPARKFKIAMSQSFV